MASRDARLTQEMQGLRTDLHVAAQHDVVEILESHLAEYAPVLLDDQIAARDADPRTLLLYVERARIVAGRVEAAHRRRDRVCRHVPERQRLVGQADPVHRAALALGAVLQRIGQASCLRLRLGLRQ
jgi:hypothetical protein